MAVPTTYAELQTEIATLSVREDLEDLIPSFIGYAENWFQRELFAPEREDTATLTVTSGVATLPTDFAGAKSVYVDGSVDRPLVQVTADKLRALYPTSGTDTPIHYAIEGQTMLFGPVPGGSEVIKLKYIEGITALSDDDTSNWLLADHPDLYINASLAELYDYTEHTEKAAKCRAKAERIAESIRVQSRRRKGNSGPLVARPHNTDAVLSYIRG
jgi:hypothetical protein